MSLMYFHNVVIVFPSKLAHSLNWTLHQGYHFWYLVEISQMVLEKKILKRCQYTFYKVALFFPLKEALPFIWINLIPLHPYCVQSLVEMGSLLLERLNMWKNNIQTEDERFQLRSAKTGHDQCAHVCYLHSLPGVLS